MPFTLTCARCGAPFERKQRGGRFCSYSCRAKFYGPPSGGPPAVKAKYEATAIDRFWLQVGKGSPDECWTWTGYRNGNGYGYLTWKGRQILAHRLALSLTDGDWNNPLHVCHSCDNPPCCNPAHLWRGSDRNNYDDMVQKGRSNRARGEANGYAKATTEMVIAIRASPESHKYLAELYNLSEPAVSHIRRRRTWRHIP